MRTLAGLRRFPSSHPSLLFSIFSGILENRMRGEREGGLNRAALPCRPVGGGATGPPCPTSPARDLFEEKIRKKNYRKVPVARCLGDRGPVAHPTGDRGHFRNFLKR